MQWKNLKTPNKVDSTNLQSKNRTSIRQYSAYKSDARKYETGGLNNSQTMHLCEGGKCFPACLKHTKKSNSLRKANQGFGILDNSETEEAESNSR